MAAATTNRLLPLLAASVVLMLVFVSVKSCSPDGVDSLVLDAVPRAPSPDADTPADTIKTLTANVAAMTAELEALRQANRQLQNENHSLIDSRGQIEENVATRLRRELLSREHGHEIRERRDAGELTALSNRIETLAQTLAETQERQAGGDIPVGLGFDSHAESLAAPELIVWIEPLDAQQAPRESPGLLRTLGRASTNVLSTARAGSGVLVEATQTEIAKSTPEPVFTVPRNATLLGSTAMTALVGRVPVQGQVRDPMPFKVITGADNLAANGLRIPGVYGMVWSGTAIGDWTLSCVTGRLDAVTFVFDDGTLRTLSSEGQESQRGRRTESLGWISDAQGIPCVSGERKTNAPAYLSQRIGTRAIEAAAQAAAAAETTSVVNDAGTSTRSLTGDAGRFVLGKSLAGASDEVAQWLLERQSQSFDAVFVPAGVELAIHVDRELAIDFLPNGRKLDHANPHDLALRTRLD